MIIGHLYRLQFLSDYALESLYIHTYVIKFKFNTSVTEIFLFKIREKNKTFESKLKYIYILQNIYIYIYTTEYIYILLYTYILQKC